jgi:imidazole glycerol-phosphate synthase subunit HisH
MTVLIVDYGMGNIASARRSLEECGVKVIVSDDPATLRVADRVVIPGVGAFPKAMQRLNDLGWSDALRSAAREDAIPVLGICLGMQLLADSGTEFEATPGLGLIPGKIERIIPVDANERVPHVGWNEVNPVAGHPLFAGLPSNADFYFVHSFRFVTDNPQDTIATTPFAGRTVAVVGKGHVVGTQFHPEKSSRAGFQVLRNFLALKSSASC